MKLMKNIYIILFLFFFIDTKGQDYNTQNVQLLDSNIREIKLQGAVNFRDLGGYKNKDGKKVKTGLLYRSATLNTLTDADIAKIAALNIKYDFDFRGPYEVKTAPDKIPAGTTRISLPAGCENVGDSNFMKNMGRYMKSDSFLLSFYTVLTPFKDRYAPLFDSLLANKNASPILFHCTAGKDRTGIAAALILYALGVDEETIFNDYEATNYYRRNENAKQIAQMTKYFGMDEKVATSMMGAKKEYIQATFTTIKAKYGTIDNYLEKVMNLNAKKIKQLKAIYTN
jgi:protein-tyrosine phosphatase